MVNQKARMSNIVDRSFPRYQSRQQNTNTWELEKGRLAMQNNQHTDTIKQGLFDNLIFNYENKM